MKKYWKQLEENGTLNSVECVYQLSQEISKMVLKIPATVFFREQNSMSSFIEHTL